MTRARDTSGRDRRIIAISGIKNSGKTTLLAALVPLLREKGLQVGVIKHDGHDFTPDVPGSDSFRLREAGAETVAVYSPHRYLLTKAESGLEAEDLLPHFEKADVILLEGGKNSLWPKIEVLRAAVSQKPAAKPEGLLALCTDTGCLVDGVPAVGLTDYEAIVRIIMRHLEQIPN